ncbi:galactokinase [Monoraphidium neglectum]|uniref:Galactokinase n=1 Tax=Monoraphidium neglectum TaxID=145388 RepID=A0A0D2M256_9CHLO|nr:galactokinase [Monoraphidium neglectum]KIY97734.1 galactokinase [Monoraphidium neglectum]|eukprot:XP_013896754.1 galactokinase [Monoraphidium neglectum]
MASDLVPVHTEVESVYGLEGRVNLIGEHIDYEGYGVLPMALRLDTVVAIARGGDKLSVGNVEAEKFPLVEYDVDPNQEAGLRPANRGGRDCLQEVDTANHVWANYFLAAYKGVFDHLSSKGEELPKPTGLQVMIHGIVPLGGGLSSSAAIVCSSALAVLAVNSITLTKGEVADFTCKAERYVGVTSGGMDQAISVMGQPNVAKLVEFNPVGLGCRVCEGHSEKQHPECAVRAEDVHLPQPATFVIANSLTVSKKQETADKKYNLRVVECRLAAALIARKLGSPSDAAARVRTLREVEPLIAAKYGEGLKGKLRAVEELLDGGLYLQPRVEEELGVPLADVFAGEASPLRVLGVVRDEGFKLRDRAAHVYSEADRVYAFQAAAADGGDSAMADLGALMDASHASCSKLYECSCPELDSLVAVAKGAGALGARLTGAGWGGCTVSLVQREQVGPFIQRLREEYFDPLLKAGRVTEGEMPEVRAQGPRGGGVPGGARRAGMSGEEGTWLVLFASPPSSGAAVLRVKLAPPQEEGAAGAEEPAREPAAA